MIYSLEKISVRKLYELGTNEFEKYIVLQNALKSKNFFNGSEGKKISNLSFAEVSEIKRIFFSPTLEGIFETFQRIFNCNRHEFLRSDVISYFYALNHIAESLKGIIEREKLLQPDDDEEKFFLQEAGVERLEVFKELPVLLNLAERFATTPQIIETWKYSLVYAIMLYDKISADVKKKHQELKKKHGN